MDYSLPGSSVHAILQARILECVVMPSSGDLPNPGIEPVFLISPASAGGFFTTSTTWETSKSHSTLLLSSLHLLSTYYIPGALDMEDTRMNINTLHERGIIIPTNVSSHLGPVL